MDAPTGLAPASRGELRAARRLTRRKDRAAQRLFLAEGPQAVREAVGANCVQTVFVALSSSSRQGALIAAAEEVGVPVRVSADDDLASLTDTQTPQGIVAVCRMADRSLDDALSSRPRLVVGCAEVRDPGNAGTVIRCADAFGADAVILSEGSVDAYNSKTVRSSAGSLFHLPLVLGSPLNAIVDVARAAGLQVLAADGHGATDLAELTARWELSRPTLWLLGNEAWGLAPEQAELADLRVRVPIYGAAESLNLGAAAAICLYASATAQRTGMPSSNRQTDSPAASARS